MKRSHPYLHLIPFFGGIIVRDGREEAVLVQVIQGFGSHSFRDSVSSKQVIEG